MFADNRKTTGLALVLFCLGLLAALPARADYINYNDFDGLTVDFLNVREISNTNPDQALFGMPTLVGNTTLFFPTDFSSTASNGASDATGGTLEMTLRAKSGFAIAGVRITEIGSYSLTGSGGTAATTASVSGLLTVGGDQVALAPQPSGDTLSFSLPTDSAGSYTATAYIDLSGLGLTEVDFSLFNLLETSSESAPDNTTATIQKSFESNKVEVELYATPVPLPGSVWLLGSSLAPLAWLRRRACCRQ